MRCKQNIWFLPFFWLFIYTSHSRCAASVENCSSHNDKNKSNFQIVGKCNKSDARTEPRVGLFVNIFSTRNHKSSSDYFPSYKTTWWGPMSNMMSEDRYCTRAQPDDTMKIILAPCLPVTQSIITSYYNLSFPLTLAPPSTQFLELEADNKRKESLRNWKSILTRDHLLIFHNVPSFNEIYYYPLNVHHKCVLYNQRRKNDQEVKKKVVSMLKALTCFSLSPRPRSSFSIKN